MPQQSWAVFLLLSSSTPFNLKMSSKWGRQICRDKHSKQYKSRGQQEYKQQRAREIKAKTRKIHKHRQKQMAIAESKKKRSWFCSHPL